MSRNTLRILVLIFGAITALVHLLYLGVGSLGNPAATPPGILFILNGIAYIVLIVVVAFDLLPKQRALVHYALIAFTAVTIIAYFVVNKGVGGPLGWITKLDEVALIIVTYLHLKATA